MLNMKRTVGAVLVAGLVVGCFTPYQRMGFRGGYRDTEVAPGIVLIEVRGNAFTGVDTLEDYFHQRAVAICRPRSYDWRLDSGTTRGLGSAIANSYGNTLHIYQQPAPAKGWGTGVISWLEGIQGGVPHVLRKAPRILPLCTLQQGLHVLHGGRMRLAPAEVRLQPSLHFLPFPSRTG
ncbi:hypothetical protein [Myxococcus sp. NMCA1]|uniref:hypothetical protein n=1 Tax=Myxococcus sp. NMCA1 TaxID=2996785 RepID=UPI002286B2D3|nr:hypothetical protein [Myxococcus sp. NMCA1]WAM25731.1 hypothetical protein OZ403_35270 [Myxococcus sp. NMCA1]